eukprot:TRINITY_DN974_c0_g1_i7.p3 TRINITY_DN974_c0_g1~~TRINITY_DN974_c0_g1_i7.p3  ORF type:complete len:223 (+),score=42.97 TRINITY_DN974_c0_g1_i7:306-974(+)
MNSPWASRTWCVSMATTLLLCALMAVVPWTTQGAAVVAPTASTRTDDARGAALLSTWLVAASRGYADRLRLDQVSPHFVELKTQPQRKGSPPIPDCQPTAVFLQNHYEFAWGVARLYVNAAPAWSIFLRARAHAVTYVQKNPKAKTVCGLRQLVSQLQRRGVELVKAHMRCHTRKDPNCPLPPGGIFRKGMNGAEKATRARVLAVPLSKPLPNNLLPTRVLP